MCECIGTILLQTTTAACGSLRLKCPLQPPMYEHWIPQLVTLLEKNVDSLEDGGVLKEMGH